MMDELKALCCCGGPGVLIIFGIGSIIWGLLTSTTYSQPIEYLGWGAWSLPHVGNFLIEGIIGLIMGIIGLLIYLYAMSD